MKDGWRAERLLSKRYLIYFRKGACTKTAIRYSYTQNYTQLYMRSGIHKSSFEENKVIVASTEDV